jgi:putative component of toxin-antitoxin plasmid stabilization module
VEAVKPKKIFTHVTADERCPFDEWLEGLKDNKVVAQIQKRLIRVELGNLGDLKSVGGGGKSTQEKDVKLAKEYWSDYGKRRNANG